jgi:hypothetical protein
MRRGETMPPIHCCPYEHMKSWYKRWVRTKAIEERKFGRGKLKQKCYEFRVVSKMIYLGGFSFLFGSFKMWTNIIKEWLREISQA